MRRLVGFLVAAVMMVGVSASSARASAISFDFSSATGASISFQNGGFSFVDGTSGFDFGVGNVYSGVSNGFTGTQGNISGNFTIGTISTSTGACFPAQVGCTVTQDSAQVTGSGGAFSLFDGSQTLTFGLNWIDIYTTSIVRTTSSGTIGGLNGGATVNLSLLSYTGTNIDFLKLMNSAQPTVILSFQFNPAQRLTTLALSKTAIRNSYSGNFTDPVPEPASMLLLGTGLIGVAGLARRRAKARQAQN